MHRHLYLDMRGCEFVLNLALRHIFHPLIVSYLYRRKTDYFFALGTICQL